MSAKGLTGAAIATTVGAVLLVALGAWQLKRLTWKEALLAEIDSRVHAPPTDIPARADWPSLKPPDYEYRHVRASGVFDYAHQALVFRALESPRGRYGGPGYLVMTPLKLDSGEYLLVNRGFVPLDHKEEADKGPRGEVQVDGLMRSTEDRTWFTPVDNPVKGEWYTRDINEIATAMALPAVAPFSIDADAGSDPMALPEAGETVLRFPNNHLSYAFTWFGLAAALAAVFVVWAYSQRTKRKA